MERNDESFIYLAEARPGRIERLHLHPTVIADYQARLATGNRRRRIAAKMTELCAELGATARWREGKGLLEIDLG